MGDKSAIECSMAHKIREVMTENPMTMSASATVAEAARAIRERNIGDVIVLEDGRVCGIVTDRDIVVRGVAQAKDPAQTKLADICSRELTTVSPNDEVAEAVRLMKGRRFAGCPSWRTGAS